MALEPRAARAGREASALAERPGTTATRRRGQGHEIREIRPFAEGDEPRHIDAAATARSGSLQVRSFHEDRERNLLLIADFRRPMLWGTAGRLRSVAAAEVLALMGWQASLHGGAVGVVALTDDGPDGQPPRPRHRGMAMVTACLARAHAAALAAAERAAALAGGAGQAARCRSGPRRSSALPARRSCVATVMDDPGEGFDAALAILAARGPLQLILVEDPFEVAPPARALPHALPEGAAFARFAGLPADRAARAARLARPGLRVRRLSTTAEPEAAE
ncbi:DUF58 domain-containing protein [Paracoccus mutanolyticus]|uniref:DUF58 domain-containing protein n=2 Tax=Paracoccus mutanolyticus TaxID=1499308 RepID=A0ABM6WUP4_9RHOB|nr:DUF58 domain-containing protein [Paracoccus mutanolyticus]